MPGGYAVLEQDLLPALSSAARALSSELQDEVAQANADRSPLTTALTELVSFFNRLVGQVPLQLSPASVCPAVPSPCFASPS
jgi:hypothetical protein